VVLTTFNLGKYKRSKNYESKNYATAVFDLWIFIPPTTFKRELAGGRKSLFKGD
jgi:hypothetical protein